MKIGSNGEIIESAVSRTAEEMYVISNRGKLVATLAALAELMRYKNRDLEQEAKLRAKIGRLSTLLDSLTAEPQLADDTARTELNIETGEPTGKKPLEISPAIEPQTAEQDLDKLMEHEIMLYLATKKSAYIRAILEHVYNLKSGEKTGPIEFSRLQDALDRLIHQSVIVHAGHGYFMAKNYYDKCIEPELEKTIIEVITKSKPKPISFLGLLDKIRRLSQGRNFVANDIVAITLHKMLARGDIKKLTYEQENGKRRSDYSLVEDSVEPETGNKAKPETKPVSIIEPEPTTDFSYPVTWSGGPPVLEFTAAQKSLRDLSVKNPPRRVASVNKKTGRKGGQGETGW
ncbi:hypothetical protein EOL96_07015 [Candidatus Saccharibacteria bacterium]|nr:hypothetical protein [Candidatus Saccharibacteria bacterium]